MVDLFMVKKKSPVIPMLITKMFGLLMLEFIFVDHRNHCLPLEMINQIIEILIVMMMTYNINIENLFCFLVFT
jgi:hypothetical protein